MSSSRGTSRWGTTLALCAGLALGQAWAFAEPQTPPGGRAAQKPTTPASGKVLAVQQASLDQKAAPPPPGCTSPPSVLGDEAFYTLKGGGIRNTSVWVDDIDSGLAGNFDPFQVIVVTGRVFAPFTLPQGKLSRNAFLKYTNGNYNTQLQAPIVVDKQSRSGQISFTQGGRTFTLKVVGVQAALMSRDTVSIQLCWS